MDDKEQSKNVLEKVKTALKDSYYIMIATPTEIYEAQQNKVLPDIVQILDIAHIRKVNELIRMAEKQSKGKGLFS